MGSGGDHFFLRHWQRIKEDLHRGFAEIPAPFMARVSSYSVAQGFKIGLQLVNRTIHLLAERDTIEHIEHGFVEALADTVGLFGPPPASFPGNQLPIISND